MIEYINFLLLLTSFSFVYFKYKNGEKIDELISVQPNITTSNDKT